ncbi:MAG: phage integrase N-terminal SAM-like domain-containing protein [Saprospiraceae bacterium]|nr:phage integrase N-terminal SAM-like domain-containing protein [Saprospiraceae bacterium]
MTQMELEKMGSVEEFRSFMTLKNFSKRTIKTYTQIVIQFVNWWKLLEEEPLNMSDDLVRRYLLQRFDNGLDWQTVNSDYSAIQKWFKNV